MGEPMPFFADMSLWELPDHRNDADGFHPGCPYCDVVRAGLDAFQAVMLSG